MIFEFKKNQLALQKFIEYNIPRIVNNHVLNLWDVHTNKISYAILNKFLEGSYDDPNGIFYAMVYLKNNGSKLMESEYISSLYDTPLFEPFMLDITCKYNKYFLDVETNNDLYDSLVRSLVNLKFEDEVVETGKYILKLNDTVHTIKPVTRKIIYDILRTAQRERIDPSECIEQWDENIITLAEEKFIKENLKHDITTFC